ncbi:hypothetical protein AUJ17_04075 [Candidatus Micrarchaeota archaeon CG1_02_47_40]|nr:MAG: hypothetical protein AUJ17_04075 [Candidatus Micrarchaeota archaeon CG1_02_47_40]QBM01413.1 hypothetical protein [uncultured archaeon]
MYEAVELTSLSRDPKPAHLKIAIAPTRICNGRCKHCYDSSAEGRASIAFWAFERNILPYLRKISTEKPHVTLVGGEPCIYRHFLPITEAIIDAKPEKLDIFTNGTLFAKPREEFWQVLKKGGDSVSIVFSYDRHHAEGVPGADGWLEKAFLHFARIWRAGSKTEFIISSTRFSEEPEKEIDARVYSLAAKYHIPIKASALYWENVFSLLPDYNLRIEVPQHNAYFELAGGYKQNGALAENGKANLTPIYKSKVFSPDLDTIKNLIKEGMHHAQKRLYAQNNPPFTIQITGEGTCEARFQFLEVERFLGTESEALSSLKDIPQNQLYIHHDGRVHTNPFAKPTPFSVLTDSLEKIAQVIYPEKEN